VIQLRANPGPTGRLLEQMLREKGLLGQPIQGVVNYGYGGSTQLPCLNRRAGTFNKLEELEMLHVKGVAVIPFSRSPMELTAPLLGRSLHHTRGRDIRVYPTQPRRLGLHPCWEHDYYTQLVPKEREFRVWCYRRRVIGIYEKVLQRAPRFSRRKRSSHIWNRRAGYDFLFRRPEEVDQELKQLATQTVDTLGLDFGAVDVLQDMVGNYLVLENNCAPGTEGPRQCIQSLVNHIDRWAKNGFKKRNGEDAL
jgi:RimK-like ATP-grasp domain